MILDCAAEFLLAPAVAVGSRHRRQIERFANPFPIVRHTRRRKRRAPHLQRVDHAAPRPVFYPAGLLFVTELATYLRKVVDPADTPPKLPRGESRRRDEASPS